jgi:hypothetical protein
MNKERIKNIAYWVTTILGPASFIIGGTSCGQKTRTA